MKSKLIEALLNKDMLTENGMVTNSTSLNALVDLFFVVGAMRKESKTDTGKDRLIAKFEAAFSQDPLIATKIMFWARNARGGAGEREVFKIVMNHLAKNKKSAALKNIKHIPTFGRFDDLFVFIGTPFEDEALDVFVKALKDGNSLSAKWAPRLGGKVSKEKKFIANKIRNKMSLDAKEYRKLIVKLTNVVETAMCQKNFSLIDFEKVPSLAMARYTKAFTKHDDGTFSSYIEALKSGDAKINSGAIYPYDVIKSLNASNSDLPIEQWRKLPNFLEGSTENLITVVDTSGSMSIPVSGNTTAMEVALSLGLYISERTEGIFKDAFITFSRSPKLQYLYGDLRSRLAQLQRSNWGMNTDIEAVFYLILDKAVTNKVLVEEMPTSILILSDMEFDRCSENADISAIEMISGKYAKAGYKRPNIIFWNIASRLGQSPIRFDEQGTALVSGFSPAILKEILTGDVNPIKIMMRTIENPIYDVIEI